MKKNTGDKQARRTLAINLQNNLSMTCYMLQDEHVKARDAASAALDIDPKNVKALYRRALANKNLLNWDAAFSDLKKALKYNPSLTDVKRVLLEANYMVEKSKHEKDAMKFSIAQLSDPDNQPASVARGNPQISAGTLYQEAFGYHIYDTTKKVFDRADVRSFHCQYWEAGKGDYYCATDIAMLSCIDMEDMGETVQGDELKGLKLLNGKNLPEGQYHRPAAKNQTNWSHYPNTEDAPGNNGGFHAAVIDTAPGTKWTLSAKFTSTDMLGRKIYGPNFIAIARQDYAGFVSSPSPHLDQCRGHLKICDYPSLKSGKFLLQDVAETKDANSDDFGMKGELGECEVAMDGYYPVTVHRDANGLIDLIYILCFEPYVTL